LGSLPENDEVGIREEWAIHDFDIIGYPYMVSPLCQAHI